MRNPRLLKRDLAEPFQRARRGYSTPDTFGFDTYLAGVIAGGVQELRDREIGHPGTLTADEWNRILDEIVAGFRQYHAADASGHDPDYDAVDHSLGLLREWWPHLWD